MADSCSEPYCRQHAVKPPCCDVCLEMSSKYRCPSCNRNTCSLQCVKLHKERFSCCGKRAPFDSNVRIDRYNDETLLKDYRFLERTGRLVEGSTRLLCQQATDRIFGGQRRCNVGLLRKLCHQRGISLRTCPGEMVKRKQNSTSIKKNKIHWKVKWTFVRSNQVCIDNRISEENTLELLLQRFLKNRSNDGKKNSAFKAYSAAGIQNVHILIRDAAFPQLQRYFELPCKAKMREALKGVTIIEHPELYVVLTDEMEGYKCVPRPVMAEIESEKTFDSEHLENQGELDDNNLVERCY